MFCNGCLERRRKLRTATHKAAEIVFRRTDHRRHAELTEIDNIEIDTGGKHEQRRTRV